MGISVTFQTSWMAGNRRADALATLPCSCSGRGGQKKKIGCVMQLNMNTSAEGRKCFFSAVFLYITSFTIENIPCFTLLSNANLFSVRFSIFSISLSSVPPLT